MSSVGKNIQSGIGAITILIVMPTMDENLKSKLDKIRDLITNPPPTKYEPFPEENKKAGLYKDRDRVIDVYFFEGTNFKRWEWGYNSDCGMNVTNDMWWEMEYLGPITDQYLAMVIGMMNCAE